MTQTRLERFEEYVGVSLEGAAFAKQQIPEYFETQYAELERLRQEKGESAPEVVALFNSLVAVQAIDDKATQVLRQSGKETLVSQPQEKPVTSYRAAQRPSWWKHS